MYPDTVKTMLAESTGLKVDTIELAEVYGSCYIFVSDTSYYVWDSASQEGWRVVQPTGRDALFSQMAKGATLELELLEYYSGDLEQ